MKNSLLTKHLLMGQEHSKSQSVLSHWISLALVLERRPLLSLEDLSFMNLGSHWFRSFIFYLKISFFLHLHC